MQHLTESELGHSVVSVARELGWLAYHTYRSKFSEPGFPDLVMVRPPRVIFAELKTETGRLTKAKWNKAKTRELPGQETWRDALELCEGVEYYLWRPRDIDEVYRILQRW